MWVYSCFLWYQGPFFGKRIDTFPVHRKTLHNFDAPKIQEKSQLLNDLKDVNKVSSKVYLWISRLKGHIWQWKILMVLIRFNQYLILSGNAPTKVYTGLYRYIFHWHVSSPCITKLTEGFGAGGHLYMISTCSTRRFQVKQVLGMLWSHPIPIVLWLVVCTTTWSLPGDAGGW